MGTPYKVSTKVTVRFSDTDAMGHCNNRNYFSFMEEGRVAYFGKLFPEFLKGDSRDAFPFILAKIECSFLSPAFCGETLLVSLGVTRFGSKSFDVEYEISEEKTGRKVATGKSVQVMFDYRTQQSVLLSDEFKNKTLKFEA